MPKKKNEEGQKEESLIGTIKELFSSSIAGMIKNTIKDSVEKAQYKIYETEQKVMKNVIVSLIFFVGVIMLVISSVFMVKDYLKLSFGFSFLMIGMLILIIALLLKVSLLKENRR